MTTYKHPRGKSYYYDFRWTKPGDSKPTRYQGVTGQLTKEAADRVEAQIKDRVRQEAYGVAPPSESPHIHKFASVHYQRIVKKDRLKRPESLKQTLRLCLQFWGQRPDRLPDAKNAPPQWAHVIEAQKSRADKAPYHDLRLRDPITDPTWIEKFEDWMTSLGLSGARKNHYRSAMSGIYRTALLPAFRKVSGVTMNPFLNLERDRVRSRDTVLTLDQLRAWIAAAPPHTRLAMAVAVYAPELRLGAILGLKWRVHLDREFTRITTGHKTERWTGKPQTIPISEELRAVLKSIRAKQVGAAHVVSLPTSDGGYVPVKRMETALKNAVKQANKTLPADQRMTYGMHDGGVTFHTIRHTMATLLAEWGWSHDLRKLLMGHLSDRTTAGYTHMAAKSKQEPLQQIASTVALRGVVQEDVPNESARPRHFSNRVTRHRRA